MHSHHHKPSSSTSSLLSYQRLRTIFIILCVVIVILQVYLLAHVLSNTFNTLESDYYAAEKIMKDGKRVFNNFTNKLSTEMKKENKTHQLQNKIMHLIDNDDETSAHQQQQKPESRIHHKKMKHHHESVADEENYLNAQKQINEKDEDLQNFLQSHPNIHTTPLHHERQDFSKKVLPPFADEDDEDVPTEAQQLLDQYADIEPSSNDLTFLNDLVDRNIIRPKTALLLRKVQTLNDLMRDAKKRRSQQQQHLNNRPGVVIHPVGQLCNRLVSISSAFVFSMLSKRALYVDDTDFYAQSSDLFLNPGFAWTSKGENGEDLAREDVMRDPILENPEQGPWSMAEPLLCSNYSSSSSSTKKTANQQSALKRSTYYYQQRQQQSSSVVFGDDHKNPTIIIRTNQYLVPYMQRNPFYRKALEYFFPTSSHGRRGGVFHIMSHFLFRPIPKLIKERDEYMKQHFNNDVIVVGLQVRAGGDFTENQMKEKDWKLYADCALASVPSKYRSNNKPHQVVKYFVATDTEAGRERAKLILGKDNVLFGPGKFLLSNHPRGVQMALLDILLLEQCHDRVTTAWSTFGYFAAGRSGFPVNLVTDQVSEDKIVADPRKGEIQRYMGIKHKSDKRRQCVRLPTVQPCFHHFENWGASKTSCAEKNWLQDEMMGGRYC